MPFGGGDEAISGSFLLFGVPFHSFERNSIEFSFLCPRGQSPGDRWQPGQGEGGQRAGEVFKANKAILSRPTLTNCRPPERASTDLGGGEVLGDIGLSFDKSVGKGICIRGERGQPWAIPPQTDLCPPPLSCNPHNLAPSP